MKKSFIRPCLNLLLAAITLSCGEEQIPTKKNDDINQQEQHENDLSKNDVSSTNLETQGDSLNLSWSHPTPTVEKQLKASWKDVKGTFQYAKTLQIFREADCSESSQYLNVDLLKDRSDYEASLEPGRFSFAITVRNTNNETRWCSPVIEILGEVAAVSGLSVTNNSASSTQIEWDQNYEGAKYLYLINPASNQENCEDGTETSSASVLLDKLSPSTKYTIAVCLVETITDSVGVTHNRSGKSSLVETETLQVPPGEIPSLSISQEGFGPPSIMVTWEAATDAKNYWIAVRQATVPEDCADKIMEVASSETTAIIDVESANASYGVRVCAVNENPSPDLSIGVTGEVFVNNPSPNQPSNPSASNITINSASILWQSGGGTTARFRVVVAEDETPDDCSNDFIETTGSSANLSSLTPNKTYRGRICSVSFDSKPLISQGVTFTFKTLEPPIPEINALSCSNLGSEPRVRWSGGTGKYFVSIRQFGSPARSCTDTGANLTTQTSNTVSCALGQTCIVWVCSWDPSHSMLHSTGRRVSVRMPTIAGSQLLPGSCSFLP